MSGMPVLVTGAAGYVGARLVSALAEQGHVVSALTRRAALPVSVAMVANAVRVFEGDIGDAEVVARACHGQAAIFHLAAFIPRDMKDAELARQCFEVNALGTQKLAEAAVAEGARLIHFSTGNLYAPSDAPVTEESPIYPAARAPYYLASKLAGELFVEHLRLTHALKAVILRVSSVYGFGARSVAYYFMRNAARGQALCVFDGGIPRYDFVEVGDVVRAALDAWASGAVGTFNIGAGKTHSLEQLAQCVAATFPDQEVKVERIPPTGEIAPNLSPLDCAKAQRAWGYAPTSLREGLAQMRREMESDARRTF